MARKDTSVLQPNLGLFFDRPRLAVPERGLLDGLNFRVKEGKLSNLNLGWSRFGDFTLNGPVALIDNFFLRDGAQFLIFGTLTDLYRYVIATDDVLFITPAEATGTVDVSAADPAVVSSASGPTAFDTNGVKAGDMISFGSATENDPAATWYEIDTVDSDTQLTLTTAVAGAPLSGEAYTIRKLFTGALDDAWEVATFVNDTASGDDLWFATNGIDDVVTWNGTDTFATLQTGLGFVCRRLVVYANMMIYGDLTTSGGTQKPTSIANSDVGDPLDVSNGLASEFVVHDGTDPIESMLAMGDNLVIYSGRTVVLTQFVGEDVVFAFRTGFSGLGPLAGRLVADFGDYHEFVSADSKYTFDGVTVEESGPQVWRDILRQRHPDRTREAFGHFDEENGDLIWAIPLTSDDGSQGPETAWSEHYLEQVPSDASTPVSKREFPFTASGYFERQTTLTWDQLTQTWAELNFRWNDQFFQAAFPFNLVGDKDGKVYTLGTSQNADGSALDSFVRFGRRVLGDGRMRGLLRRVYPFATKFTDVNLKVTVHLSDHASGPTTTSETFSFDTDLVEGGHFVSPFRRGRFVELEYGTDGPSEPWEISGYDVDMTAGGER